MCVLHLVCAGQHYDPSTSSVANINQHIIQTFVGWYKTSNVVQLNKIVGGTVVSTHAQYQAFLKVNLLMIFLAPQGALIGLDF